jgi:hypothetical protein
MYLQRQEAHLEGEADQVARAVVTRAAGAAAAYPPDHVAGAESLALPPELRAPMEQVLPYDFSGIRLHVGESAQHRARSEGAHAFTEGSDVYFAPGRYRPELPAGRALIAHELTHTAQQGAAPARRSPSSGVEAEIARIERVGTGDRSMYQQTIDAFRREHAPDALSGGRSQLCDPAMETTVSPAPPSVRRQRCLAGCSSCEQKEQQVRDAGASPVATPADAGTPVPTPGQRARVKAGDLIQQADTVKLHADRLRSGLKEIRRGKVLPFHRSKTPGIIDDLADSVKAPAAARQAGKDDWAWFLDHGPPEAAPRVSDAVWGGRVSGFFARFVPELEQLETQNPRSQATYWIKNTPAAVFDTVIGAARTEVPAAMLFAIASREGMIDEYIRRQVPSPPSDRLTEPQMATVRVDTPVSGFGALGLDDFFTDLDAPRMPIRALLPSGFDTTALTPATAVNEKGRTVNTVEARDLRSGLIALAASLTRRRALFLADAKLLGYPSPTHEEMVYWTYVYYNSGEYGGHRTLKAHGPAHPKASERRRLEDWITRREYPNAIIVLDSYRAVVRSGILPGY